MGVTRRLDPGAVGEACRRVEERNERRIEPVQLPTGTGSTPRAPLCWPGSTIDTTRPRVAWWKGSLEKNDVLGGFHMEMDGLATGKPVEFLHNPPIVAPHDSMLLLLPQSSIGGARAL